MERTAMCDNATNKGQAIPSILYKYMSLERFIKSFDDYLAGNLWFADRESLNDPMEAVPLSDRLNYSYSKLLDETKDEYDHRIKEWEKLFEDLEKVKICSLSRRADNFAMWSHYAEKHTGVCVGFEIDRNLLKEETITIAKVKYINEIPVVEYNGKLTQKVKEKLFCRKMRSWQYENEYRLLVSGKAQMYKIGKVTEVLLGSKCPLVVDRCFVDRQRELVKHAVIEQPEGKEWSIYVPKEGTEHDLGVFSTHDWQYKIDENCVSILCYRGDKSDVVFPRCLHGKPVTTINFRGSPDIFRFCYLTSVTIPEGIARIEDNAFECYTSLKSVTIGNSVKTIGNDAFKNCQELTSITIPDSVIHIGDNAFECCKSLTSVTIGECVACIGNSAFQDCTSLTSITIPSSVKSIGWGAFAGCTSLASVTIGKGVESIEDIAFQDCTSLTSVTFKGSAAVVGGSILAFPSCASLLAAGGATAGKAPMQAGTYTKDGDTWMKSRL